MSSEPSVQLSKTLAYVLRHNPAAAGLELDDFGWVGVDQLIDGMNRNGHTITEADLDSIVNQSDKKRYEVLDGRIRAAQGHSVPVNLDLKPSTPPAELFHGTVDRFVPGIREQGLVKGQRAHVHLSAESETAATVGARRGRPVILTIDSDQMSTDGHEFFVAANGVWLTEHVPARYISS